MNASFTPLTASLALMGQAPLSTPWQALRDLPLVIVVGVTGVGKSTTLAGLETAGVRLSLLPDRRFITDKVMIEPLGGSLVTDREQRFALTAHYRAQHPGGMAHALTTMAVHRDVLRHQLVFDGLRGIEEVEYAAENLPLARFLLLDAPDIVRVQRLLGRGDGFDLVSMDLSPGAELLSRLRSIGGINSVFSSIDLRLLAVLETGDVPADDIVAKTKIVVSERRNYDPRAAYEFLANLPSSRALLVDTVSKNTQQIVTIIKDWL
jgi:hypothetical protein